MDAENKNKKENFSEEVMNEIRKKRVSMLPHFYFAIGSALLGISIFAVFSIAAFGMNIFSFHFRVMRQMGFSRNLLAPIISLALGLVGVYIGAILLKKCDFSYKKNFGGILVAFVAAAVIFGIIIDISGFNERQRPPRMINMMYREIPRGDWITGRIESVSTSSASVQTKGGEIKTIVWNENTKFPPSLFDELKPGNFIRAIGKNSENVFRAEFIGGGKRYGMPRMMR